MIIITDAHISKAAGNNATFFRMLESQKKIISREKWGQDLFSNYNMTLASVF